MTAEHKRPEAVLWDLDGTLIDQTAAIVRCFATVVSDLGYGTPEPQTILRSLGGPMESTLRLFVPESRIEAGRQAFRALFPRIMLDGLIVLPGAAAAIEALAQAGRPQAILTNKHGPTARIVCEHAGFQRSIHLVVGSTDTEWNKPDPLLTRHVIERLGVGEHGCALIGDSPTDIETARRASLKVYCAATGAHTADELREAGADGAYDSLPTLMRAIGFDIDPSSGTGPRIARPEGT